MVRNFYVLFMNEKFLFICLLLTKSASNKSWFHNNKLWIHCVLPKIQLELNNAIKVIVFYVILIDTDRKHKIKNKGSYFLECAFACPWLNVTCWRKMLYFSTSLFRNIVFHCTVKSRMTQHVLLMLSLDTRSTRWFALTAII